MENMEYVILIKAHPIANVSLATRETDVRKVGKKRFLA